MTRWQKLVLHRLRNMKEVERRSVNIVRKKNIQQMTVGSNRILEARGSASCVGLRIIFPYSVPREEMLTRFMES